MRVSNQAFPFETKELNDATGEFSAYVSVHSVTDLGGDIILPKAFNRSLRNNRGRKGFKGFPVMRNHEHLIGITTAEKEDETGLLLAGKISTSTQVGRETLDLMREGILNGWSIQYRTVKSNRGEDGLRQIQEAELFEGGPVDMPMNPHTRTVSLKSINTYPDLPMAEFGRGWLPASARDRVTAWAQGDESKSAPAYLCEGVILADVIDGELKAVPNAIFAAAARAVDDEEREYLQGYYQKMGRLAPWQDGYVMQLDEALAVSMDLVCAVPTPEEGKQYGHECARYIDQYIDALRQVKALTAPAPVATPSPADLEPLRKFAIELQSYTAKRNR